MYKNQFIMEVLVKGKPVTEYIRNADLKNYGLVVDSDNNIYIEGRRGSEFELFFNNNSSKRVIVVPSVDGLSVLDGKPASDHSKGFVLGPWGSVIVPGWILDNNSAAKFVFEAQQQSYSEQSGYGTTNVGVIGAKIFEEKIEALSAFNFARYYSGNSIPPGAAGGSTSGCGGSINICSTDPWYSPAGLGSPIFGAGSGSAGYETGATPNMGSQTTQTSSSSSPDIKTAGAKLSSPGVSVEVTDQSVWLLGLGTGFGNQTQFQTQKVEFNRGAELAALVIYYNSRRNLERLGINVVRGSIRRDSSTSPNPFPANKPEGCTPPPNWQGVDRQRILNDLLSVLGTKQKPVMATLLDLIETDRLNEKYAEFLPAVLKIGI